MLFNDDVDTEAKPRPYRLKHQEKLAEQYTLQSLVLQCASQDAALSYGGRGECSCGEGKFVHLTRKTGALSFDAYFNSFYERYWREHTVIERVSLRISGSGRGWCVIRRNLGDGSSVPLLHELLTLRPGETVCLPITLSDQGGRLFAEFGAFDEGLRIDAIAWVTSQKPSRQVSVGAALCAFNRESFLICTVERLLDPMLSDVLCRIVVVNQGEAFTSPRWPALQASAEGRLELVNQPNFGGAGGFTRGVLELLDRASVDHVLLMDDDIEIEPAHIRTAAAFATYSRTPTVVGGQMLDLWRRTQMFESGSNVTPDNLLQANHRNLDLSRRASLTTLAEPIACDFNAWWFSLIPALCFHELQLPNPIFIRGDDQEFGVRLRRAGFPTVSLPPVSVWHEPFSAKPPGWQLYYDLRNRLIFASLYPEQYSLDGWVQLMKRLLSMLIRYDYGQALTIRLALRDFLAGPALDEEGGSQTHDRVMRAMSECTCPAVTDAEALPQGSDAHPLDKPGGRARLLSSFCRLTIGSPSENSAGRNSRLNPEMPLDLMKLGRRYVLTDENNRFALQFSYSVQRHWSHLLRTSITIARYAIGRRRAASRWRHSMPDLVTFESWRRRLSMEQRSAA